MKKILLDKISTRAPASWDKDATKHKLAGVLQELDDLQNLLYAEGKHAILVVLQGMDASGKDGLIRDVFSTVNRQGVQVKSFTVFISLALYFHIFSRTFIRSSSRSICSFSDTCR